MPGSGFFFKDFHTSCNFFEFKRPIALFCIFINSDSGISLVNLRIMISGFESSV